MTKYENPNTVQLPSLLRPERDPSWRESAKCKDTDTNFFYPTRGQIVAPIKVFCYDCPVRKQCAQFAIDNMISCGVFGGMSEDDRSEVRLGRRTVDISLAQALKTCSHALNRKAVGKDEKVWVTKSLVRFTSECTGLSERKIRRHLDDADDYFI